MHHKLFHSEQAILIYERGMQELEAIPAPESSTNLEVSRLKITILFNAIMAYRANNDFDEAKNAAKEGIKICQTLHEKFPLVLAWREQVARGYGNLAEVLMVQYRHAPEPSVLPDLLVAMRTAAESYQSVYREYPDRTGMKDGAAIHYLRLSACLHWADRDQEALAEFRRCLTLTNTPEQLEPGHMPNAFAIASGYALLIAEEQPNQPGDHPAAQCLEAALKIAVPMIRDNQVYRELFLNDASLQRFSQLNCISSLNAQLQRVTR